VISSVVRGRYECAVVKYIENVNEEDVPAMKQVAWEIVQQASFSYTCTLRSGHGCPRLCMHSYIATYSLRHEITVPPVNVVHDRGK
jgi:hypothetical protein